MRTAGNIIMIAGFTTFIVFGASGEDNIAAGCVALLGTFILYLGYRLEEIAERICKRVRSWKRQRRKHKKVKAWLDRAQRSI